jgi:hypothetical protein
MESFAHFVTLHQLEQWIGVPNVMNFLCSDYLKYHKSSTLFKNHSTMSLEATKNYQLLSKP